MITDEMTVYINVFRSVMTSGVMCQLNSKFDITKDHGGSQVNIKGSEQLLEPENF